MDSFFLISRVLFQQSNEGLVVRFRLCESQMLWCFFLIRQKCTLEQQCQLSIAKRLLTETFFAVYHVRKNEVISRSCKKDKKKSEATESSACSSFKPVLCKLCHVIKKCELKHHAASLVSQVMFHTNRYGVQAPLLISVQQIAKVTR